MDGETKTDLLEGVEERIEDQEIYRLDFETTTAASTEQSSLLCSREPRAAGGELLQPGDHVYMWCTLYQHHGIVIQILPTPEDDDDTTPTNDNNDDTTPAATAVSDSSCVVLIAEFTNVTLAESSSILTSASTASGAVSGGGVGGGFRFVRESEPNKWHKMKYQANPLECVTWRPGTCSAAKPSEATEILLRVRFLHECRHLLPEYHLLASNCETVAVWCVTGIWETLQYNQTIKWSQVGALAAATAVPGIGVVAAGLAHWHSQKTRERWKKTSDKLEKEFQWYRMGKKSSSPMRFEEME